MGFGRHCQGPRKTELSDFAGEYLQVDVTYVCVAIEMAEQAHAKN
jgi:hypothetical protein